MSLRSSRQILEKKVFTQDGGEIGHIEGFEIDLSSWDVKSLEVRLRRDALEALKIKRPLFGSRSVRLGVEHVSGVTDTVVLKSTLEQVGAAVAPDSEGEEAEEGSGKS